MLEDVIELKVEESYRLWVKFSDGVNGIVDMSNDTFAGVFAPLKDPQFFKTAYIEGGAVTWPNGVDIAPDAMHEELEKNGIWVLQ